MAKLEIETDLDAFLAALDGKLAISRIDEAAANREFTELCASAIMFAVRLSTPSCGVGEFFAALPMGTTFIRYATGASRPHHGLERMIYELVLEQLRVMKTNKDELTRNLGLPWS